MEPGEENLMEMGDFDENDAEQSQSSDQAESQEKGKNLYYLKKKYQKDIEMLIKKEQLKDVNEILSDEITSNVLLFHKGIKYEDDYKVIQAFVERFGECIIDHYICLPYCHLTFKDIQSVQKMIDSMSKYQRGYYTKITYNLNAMGEPQQNEHVIFVFFSKKTKDEMEAKRQMGIPSASRKIEISGLGMELDFVSEQEEQQLFPLINQQPWNKMAKRRVQHYGYEFLYGVNRINKQNKCNPFPDFLSGVVDRLHKYFEKSKVEFDQLTINDYFPGDGIPPHFDVHGSFDEIIALVSLGSGIVMSFKSYKGEEKHLYIPPRSLVFLSGEVRYAWFHQIAHRKLDIVEDRSVFRQRRISLTFRKALHKPCRCDYPFFCEDQGYDPETMKEFNPMLEKVLIIESQNQDKSKLPKTSTGKVVRAKTNEEQQIMEKALNSTDKPSEVEKKYVYEVYDKIAPHFSSTRYKPWPKIKEFLLQIPDGSFVADVGCGNGKYLGMNPNLWMVGTDRSENLLKICREKGLSVQLFTADSLKLPLRDLCFDYAISIAVIHHFSTPELRIHAIREILRILRVGGEALIYVWALEQDEKIFQEQDIFVPWNLQYKFEDQENLKNKQEYAQKQDVIINEDKQAVVYKRYYHVFKKGELENLFVGIKNATIIDSFFDHANWVVRIKKTEHL